MPFVDVIDQIAWKEAPGFLAVQAFVQKDFHRPVLSIWVFSSDGHYGLISPRMNTSVPRDQFKPVRIGENLVLNYNF